MDNSFPERSQAIRRATALLCVQLGWAPLHEVPLPNGRRADILALRPDGGFACIEVKSGAHDFLADAKWPDYREFADALYFAVDIDFPQPILPAEAGLIVASGRKTRSRASSATTVGEVQSNEMPATASGAIPLSVIAFLTAATRHAHHSAGSCSAQPGCGCFKAYGSAAKVIGVPSRSKIPTRMLSVPPSNPRK
jgi:hypothetical protein